MEYYDDSWELWLLRAAIRAYVPVLERDLSTCWEEKRRLAVRRSYLLDHPEATKDEEHGFLGRYRDSQQCEDHRIRFSRDLLRIAAKLLKELNKRLS